MVDASLQQPSGVLEDVSERSGLPADTFALYHGSKRLEGEAVLASWGVEKDSLIEVKTRGRGGMHGGGGGGGDVDGGGSVEGGGGRTDSCLGSVGSIGGVEGVGSGSSSGVGGCGFGGVGSSSGVGGADSGIGIAGGGGVGGGGDPEGGNAGQESTRSQDGKRPQNPEGKPLSLSKVHAEKQWLQNVAQLSDFSKEMNMSVREVGANILVCPPALDVESYTGTVERITKILSKRPKDGTIALRLTSMVTAGASPLPRTPEALLNWEKSLGLMQQACRWYGTCCHMCMHMHMHMFACSMPQPYRTPCIQASQLIIALIDGPLDDLMLSLALACDVRVGTPHAVYEPRVGGPATTLLPTWWLASLAYHSGAMRAVQLLKRTRTTTTAELIACGLLRGVVAADGLEAYVTGLTPTKTESAPRGNALQLIRRILHQSFSLCESDGIGHALAANSLLIAEALERLSTAPVATLPPMRPLGFELFEASAARWELRLTAELDNVAIEELISAVGGLSQKLKAQFNAGLPLPGHLLLRIEVSEEQARPTVIPIQLLHEQPQPTDERILRWLTRWEKVLASVSTLPLPTVAHLTCDAPGGGTASLAALQLAFACDLRVASPGVRLCFCCGSLLPGTPTLCPAKHTRTWISPAPPARPHTPRHTHSQAR